MYTSYKLTYPKSWVHLDRSLFQIFTVNAGWINVDFESNLALNCLYRFQLDPLNEHIEAMTYFLTMKYDVELASTYCQVLETELEILQAISKVKCYRHHLSISLSSSTES